MGRSTITKDVQGLDVKVSAKQADTSGYLRDIGITKANADITINFNSSMTASQIQALIDQQPRFVPWGTTLIFQFADGTYNLTEPLYFIGFFGGGRIFVQGNTSETAGLHTNQAVFLDFSGTASGLSSIYVNACSIQSFVIRYLKIRKFGSDVIKIRDSSASVVYCYCIGNSSSHAIVEFQRSFGRVNYTYVSGGAATGIQSDDGATIICLNNDDTGTKPVYGLDARDGAVIGRRGTKPSGSTADEHTQSGGVIR